MRQVLAAPVHAPDHPVSVDSLAGLAVSVTEVLAGKSAVHVGGQLMPVGLDVIVPDPDPLVLAVIG